jgi:pyruvate dehydrogenase E2 component (dihydrolipoamide acetyltransferase)
MQSGSISKWYLKEGDSFAPGDAICNIETDKAAIDFEAQDEGFVARILAQAGSSEIQLGDPIMVTVESADDVAAFASFSVSEAGGSESSSGPTDTSMPPPLSSPSTESAPSATSSSPAPSPAASSSPSSAASQSGGRVVASPRAYMMAKEMGYNLSDMVGTGPGGRIVAADVKEFTPSATVAQSGDMPIQTTSAPALSLGESFPEVAGAATKAVPASAAAAMSAPSQLSAPIAGAGYTDYPLSAEAQEQAARWVQAKNNVPHYYLSVHIRMDKLLELRQQLNASTQATGGASASSIGVYEMLIKAAAQSMKVVPSANASWMDSVVRVYDQVDINVVLGSGEACVTPVLRNAQQQGLHALSRQLNDAMAMFDSQGTASSSSGSPSESTFSQGPGTFTIVNVGMYGVHACAPIIREPQSCALALGALQDTIVPADNPEATEIYQNAVMMTATLSCDHRVVDGAVGAQWLSTFKNYVENPTTLLL